jgi:hypothetical protein
VNLRARELPVPVGGRRFLVSPLDAFDDRVPE